MNRSQSTQYLSVLTVVSAQNRVILEVVTLFGAHCRAALRRVVLTKILGRRIFDLNRARPLGSAASHPRDLSGNESDFGVPVIPANERHDTIVETAQLSPRTFGTFSSELPSLACPDHFRAADAPLAPGDVERR